MPAENRDVRGNEIKPAVVEVSESFTDPGGVEHTGEIGGGLWEEDDNSPFTASSTTSAQFTVAGDYDMLKLVPSRDDASFDQLQVNGDTGTNYRYVDNSDTNTTGATEWDVGTLQTVNEIILFKDRDTAIRMTVSFGDYNTGRTVAGANFNVTGPVDTFTVIDSFDSGKSCNIRVFGRSN